MTLKTGASAVALLLALSIDPALARDNPAIAASTEGNGSAESPRYGSDRNAGGQYHPRQGPDRPDGVCAGQNQDPAALAI